MTDTDELIKRMRTLEIDHEPDGWPAVQQRDISALCDAVEGNNKALDRLQSIIDRGPNIIKYKNEYFLCDGARIVRGDTVRTMLQNLIFTDC